MEEHINRIWRFDKELAFQITTSPKQKYCKAVTYLNGLPVLVSEYYDRQFRHEHLRSISEDTVMRAEDILRSIS